MDRAAEHPVEQRPCRSVVESGAHLAENLALTRHERVEPGRHTVEMQCNVVVLKLVRDALQLVDVQAGALGEQRQALRGIAAGGVDLRAVASGEADRLTVASTEPARELGGLGAGERHPLAQLHRRAAVREADEVQRAHAKCASGSASRTTMTRAKPARAR